MHPSCVGVLAALLFGPLTAIAHGDDTHAKPKYDASKVEVTEFGQEGNPKKVTRTALQNAGSIAGLLLTTECLITEVPEREKKTPAGHGPEGMGGGMDY